MDSTEIIRQLQNDPALKAEMRAVLLTEELLRVPSIVATLAETMVQHNQRLEHLEATVNSLIDHQAAMQNSLQDLIQMTTRGFATMEAGFAEMRDGFREVQNKFNEVDSRIDGLAAKFTAKFDQVDARFNEVDARIDSLDARIEGLDARTESMGERIDGLAARIESLEARIDGLDAKFTAKFDQVDSDIRNIKGDPEI
jgi:chromosome segregation ATPase